MSKSNSSGLRTLVIGIDAGSFPILEQVKSGTPTINRLINDGIGCTLESQIPPWTPSAWPSIFTGTNPGKHGIYDFLTYDGYDWRVVDATDLREMPVWEILDLAGYTSVIVNVPVTHPPNDFSGAILPGYTAPENPDCHPEGLFSEIENAIGSYRIYNPVGSDKGSLDIRQNTELIRMRGRAFRYLYREFEPEFGFIQFQQTDTICHQRPGDISALETVYQAVDVEIARIIDICNPDITLIVSDHGMGVYKGYKFRINEYLHREGFIEKTRGGSGFPSWTMVRDKNLKQGNSSTTIDDSYLERLIALLARNGFTTQRIVKLLDSVRLTGFLQRHLPNMISRTGLEQVDYSESIAYARSPRELGVRLNLMGREPDGTVSREEYEQVRESIIHKLRTVTGPEGNPVFEEVSTKDNYFDGPEIEDAVDIVTIPANFDNELSIELSDKLFGKLTNPWNHKLDGLFIGHGQINRGINIESRSLLDIAPTILASLDVEISDRMDGDVIPIVKPTNEISYPQYRHSEDHIGDNSDVIRHLEDIGYL